MADYWIDLFSAQTWSEFLEAGADVSGFRERRWSAVRRLKVGDILLCYLTGVSRFIGALEVVRPAFRSAEPIWKDESFPCRVGVKPLVTLTPETAVPILDLRDRLSIFKPDQPRVWTGAVRGSPTRFRGKDGDAIMAALREAETNPVRRPVDKRKLAARPKAVTATRMGAEVTIPERVEETEPTAVEAEAPEPREHTEIQWLLLRLGADLGLDVWVARSDRGRGWKGQRFSEMPRFRRQLPRQFDDATNRTVEQIDVLWLSGNSIVAAFEVESTTSIYSGLLRMSDLVAMQPNLNIPLYILAPDERRDRVINEVGRPTFERLRPPLTEICRFIAFYALRGWIDQYSDVLRYVKPEFLLELSESCEPESV